MDKPERLELQSADGVQLNLDALYQIAPSCFTEATDPKTGKVKRMVNFDILRRLLGDDSVEDAPEAYEFNWVGKQAARAEVLQPIRKTLRPVKEDSVDWDNTQNLYIEGDNLEVLKLLQKSYLGKVKMIYIDPPYNTGSDFIYHDDYKKNQLEYDHESGVVDELGNRYLKNTDSNGKYHSDWCSMIYSRLMVAKTLLNEEGAIFVSIDYNEAHNMRKILDEVFGSENFQREIIWRMGWLSGYKTTAPNFIRNHDTIFFYTKNSSKFKFNKKYINNNEFKPLFRDSTEYREFCSELGLDKQKTKNLYNFLNYTNRPERYPLEDTWNCNEYDDLNSIQIVSFSGEKASKILGVAEDYKGQKSIKMIERILDCCIEKDDIILDFFAGTASTAHAVLEHSLNTQCKYIMVQIPEPTDPEDEYYKSGYKTLCDIGEGRIRIVGKSIKEEHPDAKDLDTGFRVFRVDSSNFEEVEHAPKEWNQDQLDLFLNNIKSDRDDLDLLFGCLLDWGVKLSLPMTSEEVDGKKIYTVNEGDLVACFAEKVTDNVVKAMAEKQPLRVIFRDSCFARDADKINIYETFKQLMDWTDEQVVKNIRVI